MGALALGVGLGLNRRYGTVTPQNIALTGGQVSDADWAGRQIGRVDASPAGLYTYSLVGDPGQWLSVSRSGAIRLLRTPVPGQTINYRIRATALLGGAYVERDFSTTIGAISYQDHLAEWFSTDTLSTLKQDVAKTVAVANDGDLVASWLGKVAGWEFQQSTTGFRLPYRTGVIGANAGLYFVGNSGSWMQSVSAGLTNFMAGRSDYGIIVIGRTATDAAGNFISWAAGTSPRFSLGINTQAASAGDVGNPAYCSRADDSNTTLYGPITLYGHTAPGNAIVLAAAGNADSADIIYNGRYNRMFTATGFGASSLTNCRIGQRAGAANNTLNGHISDILIYDAYASPYVRQQQLRQFLALRGLAGLIAAEPADLDLSTGFNQIYFEDFDDPSTSNVLDYLNADYSRDRIDPQKLIPSYIASRTVDGSPGATGGEKEWMADPRPGSAFAPYPTMRVENDKLVMSPIATPAALSAAAGGQPYLGAAVISKGFVDCEPGAYFEACIRYPSARRGERGPFPAWWLLDFAGLWTPSEIDIMEMFGGGAGDATGVGQDVNGTRRNLLSINSHNSYVWPRVAASQGDSTNGGPNLGQVVVPHDLTADQHLIGARMTATGCEIYLDRKLRGFIPLVPNAVYGATINNAGDGSIPAGNLTVVVKSPNCASTATLVFSTSGGVITGLSSVSKGGAGFTDPGAIAFYRSNGTTPLGYGVSLTALVGSETLRSNIYQDPMYFLLNYAVSGSGIDNGNIDPFVTERPMWVDWIRVYDKAIPTPAIGGGQDATTTSLLSKFSSLGFTPSTPQVTAIDTFYKLLKAYALREDTETQNDRLDWDPTYNTMFKRIGGLYVLKHAPSEAAALVNWVNPGGTVAAKNGSPVFDPSFGVQFSSTIGEYLETSYGMGGTPIFLPWDNHIGVYVEEGPAHTDWRHIVGANPTAGTGVFVSLGNSEVGLGTSNSNYNLYGAPTISHGIKPVPRGHVVWATGYIPKRHVFKDGREWTAGYQTSITTPPAKWSGSTMKLGASQAGVAGAAGKYSAFHFGGKLTMRECGILKSLLDNLWSVF